MAAVHTRMLRRGLLAWSLLGVACSHGAAGAPGSGNAGAGGMRAGAGGAQPTQMPVAGQSGATAASAGAAAAGASGAAAMMGGSAGASGQAALAGHDAAESGRGGAAAGSTAGASAGGAGANHPSSWRIAFLGDSITETSCPSQLVFAALRAQGHSNFDLVGTKQNQQGCGVADPDREVEGHSGYLVTELAAGGPKAAELPMWCAADRADLVLMHFGTNDAWNSGIRIADILSAYSDVLRALRAVQPHVIVLVAQIIPLSPDGCADCEGRVRDLNGEIPMWAASESTADSPVHVVDQWTGFDSGRDAYDRVHPNMMGSQRMADAWLSALRAQKIF
jgi:lysophospholipase L1-like esterase